VEELAQQTLADLELVRRLLDGQPGAGGVDLTKALGAELRQAVEAGHVLGGGGQVAISLGLAADRASETRAPLADLLPVLVSDEVHLVSL